jgi:hypothetical protein
MMNGMALSSHRRSRVGLNLRPRRLGPALARHLPSLVPLQHLERVLDVIDPRGVIGAKKAVDRLARPAEPARQLGAVEARLLQRPVKRTFLSRHQRKLDLRVMVPLDLPLARRLGQAAVLNDPRGDHLLQYDGRVPAHLLPVVADRNELGKCLAGRALRATGGRFDVNEVDHARPRIVPRNAHAWHRLTRSQVKVYDALPGCPGDDLNHDVLRGGTGSQRIYRNDATDGSIAGQATNEAVNGTNDLVEIAAAMQEKGYLRLVQKEAKRQPPLRFVGAVSHQSASLAAFNTNDRGRKSHRRQ